VTEKEWAASTNPDAMLKFLKDRHVSERKFRLFTVAVCRFIWPLLSEESSRNAVEVAERYADALASKKELAKARLAARAVSWNAAAARAHRVSWDGPGRVAWWTVCEKIQSAASQAARTSSWYSSCRRSEMGSHASSLVGTLRGEPVWQANLLRDIIGNPFHPLPVLAHSLRTWNDGVILRLANALYEERALPAGTLDGERFAILADALEEGGCTDADVLGHCRQPGHIHVRGCWLVDWLTGRS
jgi:hypothetical protein